MRNTWSSGGTALGRVRGTTSHLDLPSQTPLSVADCGQLQLGARHWATSVNYCKSLIIEPTLCGSRFSTLRLLAIEDFTFTFKILICKLLIVYHRSCDSSDWDGTASISSGVSLSCQELSGQYNPSQTSLTRTNTLASN